ncbi:MAG: D-sedoheptulose 7-phosphate isomerase [Bacteroidota bacterium]
MKAIIEANLTEAREVLYEFISTPASIEAVISGAQILIDTINRGRKIISCGNGGSLTDAMHFAEELSGRFREKRKALPAICISDPSHITCVANDFGFDEVFSRYIEGVGQEGDALLVISTTGNSINLIKAVEAAREKKIKVVGLTGKTGGLLAGMVDTEIRVKGRKYSDRIQEMHVKIIHILVQLLEEGVSK